MQAASDPAPSSSIRQAWVSPVVFLVLTLALFGPILFGADSGERVISSESTDLTLQFLAWRDFGFSQLAQGHLPLWNPHIYGGAPYFAGFQSALLYPPNWLHLILPLARAINWIVALHVFMAGYFTYLWCRHRSRGVVGPILAGVMFMFCGPYFLHVYAGHLPHVCVMVWIPLIFLAIDGLCETGRAKWWLLGMLAVAMQTLAGHPQYVYYTGIVATVYFALRLASLSLYSGRGVGRGSLPEAGENPLPRPLPEYRERVIGALGGFIGMYVCAVALAAIQLLPGFAVTSESVRSGGLTYGMAGTFSLPPENALTLFAPNILGSLPPTSQDTLGMYFGRGYLWEFSVFVSITGLVLAIYGAIASQSRYRFVAAAMAVICILLALGRHTPLLYWLMYKFVPQYSSFRGTVKFASMAALFIATLASLGLDRLLSRARAPHTMWIGALVLTIALTFLAVSLRTSADAGPTGWWGSMLNGISQARTTDDANELFLYPPQEYRDAAFIQDTVLRASHAAACGAVTAGMLATVLILARFLPKSAYALPALAAVELFVFAHGALVTAPAKLALPAAWQTALSRLQPDARVLAMGEEYFNAGMLFGFDNLWGYDPGVLKRYAELMTFSQGFDPDHAMQYLPFRTVHPNIFRLARCQFVLRPVEDHPTIELRDALPTLVLVRNYNIVRKRDDVFRRLSSESFDPRNTVLLETEPPIEPAKGNTVGTAEIVRQTTDSLEVRVNIDTPALLLITNNFAAGWRVRSLDRPPVQGSYAIQPADYAFQSIALQQGSHHLLIEYDPRSFEAGKWLSIFTFFPLCGATLLVGWRERNLWRRNAARPVQVTA